MRYDKIREWKLNSDEVVFIKSFPNICPLFASDIYDGLNYYNLNIEELVKLMPVYKSKKNILSTVRKLNRKKIFTSVVFSDKILIRATDKYLEWVVI